MIEIESEREEEEEKENREKIDPIAILNCIQYNLIDSVYNNIL